MPVSLMSTGMELFWEIIEQELGSRNRHWPWQETLGGLRPDIHSFPFLDTERFTRLFEISRKAITRDSRHCYQDKFP